MSLTACGSTAVALPLLLRRMRGSCKKGLDPFDAGVQYAHKESSSVLSRAIRQVIKKTRPGCLVCPQNQGTLLRSGQARAAGRLFLPGGALHGCSPLWLPLFPDGDSLRTRFRDTVPWLHGLFQGLLGRLRRLEVAGANAHGSRRLCIARCAMRHRRPGASRRPARAGDLPRHRTGLPAHRTDRAVPGTGRAGDGGGAAGKRGCPVQRGELWLGQAA